MSNWLKKENKDQSSLKKKPVNDKIKRIKNREKRSAMKYVKKTKLVPEIKKADSRADLKDLLQNVDNEVEQLIKKHNPMAWEKVSNKKQKKEASQITQNPFESAPKGQANQVDFSHIGNTSRNNKNTSQSVEKDDEDPAGQWSMNKIAQIGNNGQSQVPGYSKQ